MSEINSGANNNPAPKSGTDGAFSLEDLDKLIETESPGFNDSLNSIQADRNNDETSIESLDVEVEGATEDVIEKKGPIKARVVFEKFTKPFKKTAGWIHLHRISFKNRAKIFFSQSKHFLKNDLPEFFRFLVAQTKVGIKWSKSWIQKFTALPRSKKAMFIGIGLSSFFALFFLVKALTGEWLPVWKNPLIQSLSDKTDHVFTVKKEDMIPFFDAFPEVEFQLLLTKMIVNLTPSSEISNPMGAFEFYLGLDSNETAIEIKDREKEVLDLTQRTVEEFTYEEVNNPTGQIRMKSRIRDSINQILNQGHVQKVYIKTLLTYRQ